MMRSNLFALKRSDGVDLPAADEHDGSHWPAVQMRFRY